LRVRFRAAVPFSYWWLPIDRIVIGAAAGLLWTAGLP